MCSWNLGLPPPFAHEAKTLRLTKFLARSDAILQRASFFWWCRVGSKYLLRPAPPSVVCATRAPWDSVFSHNLDSFYPQTQIPKLAAEIFIRSRSSRVKRRRFALLIPPMKWRYFAKGEFFFNLANWSSKKYRAGQRNLRNVAKPWS